MHAPTRTSTLVRKVYKCPWPPTLICEGVELPGLGRLGHVDDEPPLRRYLHLHRVHQLRLSRALLDQLQVADQIYQQCI